LQVPPDIFEDVPNEEAYELTSKPQLLAFDTSAVACTVPPSEGNDDGVTKNCVITGFGTAPEAI
jgi:hypothetical protein